VAQFNRWKTELNIGPPSQTGSLLNREQCKTFIHGFDLTKSFIHLMMPTFVDGNWSMTLEKIYLDGWRCEYVDIKIDITVDGSRQVQDQSLRTDRACWW
jgi:hypothetical protein